MKEEKEDNRLKKEDSSEVRSDRATQDRPLTEDRTMTDDARLEAFKKSFHQSALPDIPPIPGYHVCWLTTTNSRDPIARRVMWGYEPIKANETRGMEFASLKTGDYAGCIGINEMVAFKIRNELYEQIMLEAHHYDPIRQEEAIKSGIDMMVENARAVNRNARIEVEADSAALGKSARTPTFL